MSSRYHHNAMAPHASYTQRTPLEDEDIKSESAATTSSMGSKRKRGMEVKYYAVRVGHQPGIYHTWADCLAQVKGYKNATCMLLLYFYFFTFFLHRLRRVLERPVRFLFARSFFFSLVRKEPGKNVHNRSCMQRSPEADIHLSANLTRPASNMPRIS